MTSANGVGARASASGDVRPHQKRYGRSVSHQTHGQMDVLANHMADGCPSVTEAGRRMGLSQGRADQLWQRIRRQLGPQAA